MQEPKASQGRDPGAPTCPPCWWEDGAALRRLLADLLVAELQRLRPGVLSLPPLPWPDTLDLGADLGVDSLERLSLAAAVAEALQLQHSGVEDRLLQGASLAEWEALARAGLRTGPSRIAFRTSGSTGTPKTCLHSYADLWQEVAALAPLLGQPRRILCAVPSHHIYGFLFSVLLPCAQADRPEVVDVRAMLPGSLPRQLRGGDLMVAHPLYWQALADAGERVPPGVTGLSSTAPLPDATAHALAALGIGCLVQLYGSSETAGIGWRTDAAAPYRPLSCWQRDPDGGDRLVRTDAAGQRRVVALQDRLQWHGGGFLPAGRIDQAVQVGGVNVFPARVCELLRRHPDVADAAVRLMRPDEGWRLKAYIVPRVPREGAAAATELAAALRGWLRERLSPAECPASLTFGAQLPRGAGGKAGDWIASGAA